MIAVIESGRGELRERVRGRVIRVRAKVWVVWVVLKEPRVALSLSPYDDGLLIS